jgi:hypothetical protein
MKQHAALLNCIVMENLARFGRDTSIFCKITVKSWPSKVVPSF